MRIAIIDADLIGRKRHKFPNLVCMKLSGFYKEQGALVHLKLDYEDLQEYDKVFISKVFTDTPVPSEVLDLPNVTCNSSKVITNEPKKMPPCFGCPARNARRKIRVFHRRMKSSRLPCQSYSAAPGL